MSQRGLSVIRNGAGCDKESSVITRASPPPLHLSSLADARPQGTCFSRFAPPPLSVCHPSRMSLRGGPALPASHLPHPFPLVIPRGRQAAGDLLSSLRAAATLFLLSS